MRVKFNPLMVVITLLGFFGILLQWTEAHAQTSSFTFERSNYRVQEGGSVTIPLSRENGTSGDSRVFVKIAGQSATGGEDFIRLEVSNPLDFNAGIRWESGELLDNVTGLPKAIVIQALEDNKAGEGDETLSLEITSVTGGNKGRIQQVVVTIEDDDTGSTGQSGSFRFGSAEYRTKEGELVEIPLLREGGSSGAADVSISIESETATAGDDYNRAGVPNALDFRLTARWADGEVEDFVTGRPKSVKIQTLIDSLGEGTETLVIKMNRVTGGSKGTITESRIYIEDAPVGNCTAPRLSRFVVGDLDTNSISDRFDNTTNSFRGSYILEENAFALMVVGNSCVNNIRFRFEGGTFSDVAPAFSIDGERYFRLAGGSNSEMFYDFSLGGGRICSHADILCHKRMVEVAPVGSGGNSIKQQLKALVDISDGYTCTIGAARRTEIANRNPETADFSGCDIQNGFIPTPVLGMCRNPQTGKVSYARGALGSPYLARTLGSIVNPIVVSRGQSIPLDLLDPANRSGYESVFEGFDEENNYIITTSDPNLRSELADEIVVYRPNPPDETAMGVYVYNSPRNGGLSTNHNGATWSGGKWHNPDNQGRIHYKATRVGTDKFFYTVVPPNPIQEAGADPYNACISSKAQVFLKVVESENDRPKITSISPSRVTVEVGSTRSVTVNASDDGGVSSLKYLAKSNETDLAAVSPTTSSTTRTFRVSGVKVGISSITFTVNDAQGLAASQTVTVEVVVGGITNPPPANGNCKYPGGDTSKWGWDNVARKSCKPVESAPPPPENGNCKYPGGDTSKWGWDNVLNKSCKPVANATTPPVVNPEPITPSDSNSCVYPGGDTSKWGWDNVAKKSCMPVASTATPPVMNPGPTTPSGSNSCVYPGGDTSKWGWDNVAKKSCKPVANTATPPVMNPGPTTPSNSNSCVYPGGDTSKWGWDNVAKKSCRPT